MEVGIDSIGIYIPKLAVSLEDLAIARGKNPEKAIETTGNFSFSIPDADEDCISMATEALIALMSSNNLEASDIKRLQVATETQVDFAQPIGAVVHRNLSLPKNVDVRPDAHFACLSGYLALEDAMFWAVSHPGSSAIVIATDIAKYELNSPAELTQGAGALAILVKTDPKILSIDHKLVGVHTDGSDNTFYRPTGRDTPIVDGRKSIDFYLEALKSSFNEFRTRTNKDLKDFDSLIFHLPFANMAVYAFNKLFPDLNETERKEFFDKKVKPSLTYVKEIGNVYTASLFLALASLLVSSYTSGKELTGKNLGIFAYGSGSGGRFTQGTFNRRYESEGERFSKKMQGLLLNRDFLSIVEYEKLHEKERISPLTTGKCRLSRIINGYRTYNLNSK